MFSVTWTCSRGCFYGEDSAENFSERVDTFEALKDTDSQTLCRPCNHRTPRDLSYFLKTHESISLGMVMIIVFPYFQKRKYALYLTSLQVQTIRA